MMSASNIHFEMAERSRAINYGDIGAIHLMGQKLGLARRSIPAAAAQEASPLSRE